MRFNLTTRSAAGSLMVLLFTGGAHAADLFVPGGFPTIQAAVDAAADNDVIHVAPGAYNERLVIGDLDLVILATDGPEVTTITGAGFSGSIITHGGGNLTLDGFTITGGNSASGGAIHSAGDGTLALNGVRLINNRAEVGGAVSLDPFAVLTAFNCEFIGNTATGDGGAVHASSATIDLTSSTFDGNVATLAGGAVFATAAECSVLECVFRNGRAGTGGALALAATSLNVSSCEFTDHVASGVGGGVLDITGASDTTLTRCLLARNSAAGDGGAIRHDGEGQLNLRQSILAWNVSTQGRGGALFNGAASTLICASSTIYGNSALDGGGIRSTSAIFAPVSNTVLWANTDQSGSMTLAQVNGATESSFCDVEGGLDGPGNISADPGFTDPDTLDFTFTAASPLYNAGSNALVEQFDLVDFAGNNRIADGIVDIGAIEFRRDTYNVPGDFATITEAVNFVRSGETILVAAGFYMESVNFQGKGISLIGASTRGGFSGAIIVPTEGRGVTIIDPESPALIANVVITSGAAAQGAGAYLSGDVTMEGCSITGCVADTEGGGLYVAGPVTVIDTSIGGVSAGVDGGGVYIDTHPDGGTALFRNSNIVDCAALNGAGVFCIAPARFVGCNITDNDAGFFGGGILNTNDGELEMINCRVMTNTAENAGGGVYTGLGAGAVITGCLFSGNIGGSGGGLYIDQNSFTRVTNCTISANHSGLDGGGGLGAHINNTDALISNSILYGNTSENEGAPEYFISAGSGGGRGEVNDIIINHSCVRFGWKGTGAGNISDDPLFTTPGTNFILTDTSPCLDLSDMSTLITSRDSDDLDGDGFVNEYYPVDVNGAPRVRNGRADLGAMEAISGPSHGRWIGAFASGWSSPKSWFPDVPGSDNNVIFNLIDTLAFLEGPTTHTQMHVDNGTLILDLAGDTLTLTDDLLGPAVSIGAWSDLPTIFAPRDGIIETTAPAPVYIGRMGTYSGSANVVGSLAVAGRLDPDDLFFANLFVTDDLILDPVDPLGVQRTGHVFIDIATPRGRGVITDTIHASNNARLAGALTVRDDGLTEPGIGTELPIITCSGILTGQFDVAFMPGLPDGSFYRVIYRREAERGFLPKVILTVDALGAGIDFDPSSPFPLGGSATDSAVGDLNGDGLPDLAVTIPDDSPVNPGSVVILFNGGNTGNMWNGFTSSVQYTVGREPVAVDIGELDGAPGLDLAVLNRADDSVTVLINDGAGLLSTGAVLPAVIDDGRALIVFDADGDGRAEIAATGLRNGQGRVVVVPNSSSRTLAFGAPRYFRANDDPGDLDPADFDNDKDPDIVTTDRTGGMINVLRNQGGPGNVDFQKTPGDVPVGMQPLASVAPDVDGDGLPDIITANGDGQSVTVILNRSSGGDIAFAEPADFSVNGRVRSIVAVDMDGDGPGEQGDADLAIVVEDGDGNGTVRILRNDTNSEEPLFADDGEVEVAGNVLFLESADVDDDGFNDLVTVNDLVGTRGGPSERSVRVLLNRRSNCLGDVNGDGTVDMNDINALFDFWGQSVRAGSRGDLDFNGNVDFHDLNLVLETWGLSCN